MTYLGHRERSGAAPHAWMQFPVATLVANIAGAFLLVLFVECCRRSRVGMPQAWHAFFAVGVCGGFTTYSTFNLELLRLVQEGKLLRVATYLVVTVAGAFLAGLLAFSSARIFVDR